jgi:hypothetical protein
MSIRHRSEGPLSPPGLEAPTTLPSGHKPAKHFTNAGWASGQVQLGPKNLAPLGFEPRTFQRVASRYANFAVPTTGCTVAQ